MKRDMELIRNILLNVQNGNPNEQIDDIDEDTLKYHKALLIQANLAEGNIKTNNITYTEIPAAVLISQLTWEGHDFIDAIQDTNRWLKVKAYLKEGGRILTLETIKNAVKHLFM